MSWCIPGSCHWMALWTHPGATPKVIAAAVIGGVSIYGAVGTISGVVSGAVLLSVITVGIVLLQISGSMQNFFVGLVLVIAVVLDRARQTRKFRISIEETEKSA